MDQEEDLSCRLYIRSDDDNNGLYKRIAEYFGGQKCYRGGVMDEYLDLTLKNNKDFSPHLMKEYGGFIYFPYTAMVYPLHEHKLR